MNTAPLVSLIVGIGLLLIVAIVIIRTVKVDRVHEVALFVENVGAVVRHGWTRN